jgi:hypothetical protein
MMTAAGAPCQVIVISPSAATLFTTAGSAARASLIVMMPKLN